MNRAKSVRRRAFLHALSGLVLEPLEDRRLLAAVSDLTGAAFSQLAIDPGEYRSTSLLVQFRPGATAAAVAGTDLGAGWEIVPGLREVTLESEADFFAVLKAYKENPDILFAEPDFRVSLALTPNDPSFGELWGLNNTGQTGGTPDADIDAPEAWEVTTGATSVVVAVIDTGVDYTHPDLYRNVWINQAEIPTGILAGLLDLDGDGRITFYDLNNPLNQGPGKITDLNVNGHIDGGDLLTNGSGWENGQDNDADGKIDDLIGWNFVTNTNDPLDDHFHGTHVSGTIGAVGNDGVGVAGVNWTVQNMAMKFLDASGGGFISDAIEALNYSVGHGAVVSNNSWGGGPSSAALQAAIQSAATAGHIFVAAAGNDSSDNDFSPSYPASYEVDNVVAVAASDHNDELAWFSNYGVSTVDLAAPGLDIVSTFPSYLTDAMAFAGFGTDYGMISGTSMATPHVTGVVALIRSLHPEWTYDQVIGQMLNTVDSAPGLAQTITGGRVNAAAAVGNPAPDTTGPRVIVSDPAGSVTGTVSHVRLRFSEPIDATTFTVADVASFTSPDGPIAITAVVPVPGSSRQFDVTFAPQSAEGAYSLVIGPDIRDLSGNLMNQDSDATGGEVPDDQYTAAFSILDTLVIHSTDVPAPIFDLTATGSYLTVGADVTIADLNVQLNITHTYDGDLAIYLFSPSGNYTFLSYFYGDAGDNFQDTIFDDEASTPIWAGSAPFAGSYQPDTPLSVFDGENAQGTWELWIEDWGFFDEGWLNSWSITITPTGSSPPPPPPPPPPGNQPPNAGDDSINGTEDEQRTVVPSTELLGNDSDPDGDPLTLVAVGDASGGSVVLNGDGTITFTPDPDYNGSASFIYTIEDGNGGSATGFVDVTLVPVNDPPVAADDTAVALRNTPLVLDWSSLLANDTDVDGDALTLAAVGGATGGSVVLSGDTITFTPDAGYLGPAGFEYTVSDGMDTTTANVAIDVRDVYYFSAAASGTVTNSDGSTLSFSDADILQLSISAGGDYRYSFYFDGSDVGLTTGNEDIDAFAILQGGTIIVSTVGSYSVPGPSGALTGNGSNLLAFTPSSLGENTAGAWSLYLQGSSVGLSSGGENIDAVAVLADGSLVLSTTGNVAVPDASGVDTDLLRYASGTWQMYFDGGDVELTTSNEDVDGVFIRENPAGLPTLHLSTRGNFSVTGVSGANEDVLQFDPIAVGDTTSGGYSLAFDGSLYGLASHDLDGIFIGVAPNQLLVDASAASASASSLAPGADVSSGVAAGKSLLAPSIAALVAQDLFFQRLGNEIAVGKFALVREALVPAPAIQSISTPPSPAVHAAAVDQALGAWTTRSSDLGDSEPSLRRTKRAPADDASFEHLLDDLLRPSL